VLDFGFEEQEGIAVIRTLRRAYPQLKMMLVSNYPEAQAAAVARELSPALASVT